jgi:peptidoglycan/LPS O-acetylase OafA/YrhL
MFFLQPFKSFPFGGNGPLWSLSYELWYYLVFYSLIFILSLILTRNVNLNVIPHLIILLVAFNILNSDWLELGSVWVSGALVAYFLNSKSIMMFSAKYQNKKTLKFTILTCFIIIPVLIALRFLPHQFSFPILVLALTFCLAINSIETCSGINKKAQKLIVTGSDFSFSLYLIHFPVVALLASYLTPLNRWNMTPLGLFLLLGITFVVLATAYGFAWLTEFNLVRVRAFLRALGKKPLFRSN